MRLRFWRHKRRQEELEEEIQSHLRMATRDRIERGEQPQQAAESAQRELGNVGLIRDVTRDQWGWRWLEQLLQDLRYGARLLARNPGFTAVAVLTLALGIGVNAGIFGIFNGLALRPVGLAGPGRFLSVYQDFQVTHGPLHRNVHSSVSLFSYSEYRAYRDQNHVFSGLLAYDPFVQATLGGERPMDFLGTLASCNHFAVLNVRPALGRDFVESDCAATGSGAVVILSDEMWRSAFAADPSVIGKPISLNRIPLTIVGVAPEGFVGTEVVPSAFWVPLTMQPGLHSGRGQDEDMLADDDLSWLQLIGRIRDGIPNEQARADLMVIAARLDRRHPGAASKLTVATPTLFGRPEEHRAVLAVGAVILCAVGLILLIACANIASLLLARGAGRRREIAVRLTVGASRGRLVRQLLTESLLLALLGAALGFVLAIWSFEAALRFVLAHLPQGFPALALNVGPDFRVLGYTLALTFFTAIGFGLAPALRASRVDFNSALKEEGSEGKSKQPHGSFLRRSLVGLQVAMSMILLITAGLLLRGLVRAQTIDPGFATKNIAAISFDLASQGYSPERAAAFEGELMARLSTLPGVDAVAQAASIPLGNSHNGTAASVPGHADQQDVEFNAVSPNFFATMTIPIVRGRTFSDAEVQTDARAIIVTEAVARRFWPGEDPIGKRLMLHMPGNPVYEVVGVAKDAQVSHLGEAHPSYLYLPAGPGEQVGQQVLVHAATGFDASQNGIRAAVGALDPQLAVRILRLEDYLEFWRAPSRLAAILAVTLGALALLLASIGVYGMVSYAVSRRTHEIGIRLALGADGSDVVKLILQQALRPVIWGALAGIACCAAVSRVLTGLLFGVSAMDPLTFAGAALVLVLVALAACYLPARRAMRVDPIVALRYE